MSGLNDDIDVYHQTPADKRSYILKLKQKITWHGLYISTIVENRASSYNKHITNQIRGTNSLKALRQKKKFSLKITFPTASSRVPKIVVFLQEPERVLMSSGCFLPWKTQLCLCHGAGWHERCYRSCQGGAVGVWEGRFSNQLKKRSCKSLKFCHMRSPDSDFLLFLGILQPAGIKKGMKLKQCCST